ncbi:unnamed protein product [Eruca vesicaria subsp. sativa]|uniref:Uncharacterized protein n=1 Tax=Eruca vesicaria subsp. sativa TaxID=29727 RepID=A0ABC8M936_ERUVS|nr:unnamed protein product [Eruca vesicaria subsp. sativa]
MGCDQLRKLPDISGTITELGITDTLLDEFNESIRHWSCLQLLYISGSVTPYQRSFLALILDGSGADFERIPDCIKDLYGLEDLIIYGCPKLASLPELPRSLTGLMVRKCESLETLVPFPFDSQIEYLFFPDCFKLGREAKRVITQRSWQACPPGRSIPSEFSDKAIGNFLAICSNAYRVKICLVLSPNQEMKELNGRKLMWRISINGCLKENCIFLLPFTIQSEHLSIFHSEILREDRQLEQYSEILFEFSASSKDIKIIECGVQILKNKTNSKQLLEDEDRSLSEKSFEKDASGVEIIEDSRGSLEYDAS